MTQSYCLDVTVTGIFSLCLAFPTPAEELTLLEMLLIFLHFSSLCMERRFNHSCIPCECSMFSFSVTSWFFPFSEHTVAQIIVWR